MRKKKILYFVEAFGGGIFTYLVNLTNELCDEYDIYIAYGLRKQTPKNFKKYFDKRIHLIKVQNYQRSISLLRDTKALLEMKRIANKVKPDIIHLNSSKAGILGRFLFRNSNVPVFYTPHGYSFLMADISNQKKAFYKLLEKAFAFKNIETIACSKGEYEITKELTSNATYVDNGINLKEFDGINMDHQTNFDHLKIATLGRISLQKNPVMFNRIAESFPNVDFIWIGDGELRDKLTTPNIKVTGWVDNKTALNYLADTDIFILTSLWEGLPMALLEAMYMKKICIVSDVVGNRDVIHDEQNGYICDSVNDFIKKVKSISTDRLMLPELIKKAHDDVVNHYNSTVMANEYKKIYTIK
ncbi:glycosyltransferase [Lactobacillus amylovorus]|jgi:glycosyltransferase involved in cell wall biosynthesis|uniref:glycosyltransferase n=1 Tax=Lactobacillus amylovorus TaxID=1604 RepID=UPI001F15BDA5|nr:glycosyltransferase [Lactobacillus amylovorus]MDB6223325.1 glycosyltransferase [Lactobacillus amylovorus]UIK34920.1 glycosyltransferase [Lactobacillus amylovorus]